MTKEEKIGLALALLLSDKLKSNISKDPPFFLKILDNSSKVFLAGSWMIYPKILIFFFAHSSISSINFFSSSGYLSLGVNNSPCAPASVK